MIKVSSAAVLFMMFVSPALAEIVPFSKSGDWAILKDGDRAGNCFAEAQFSDGALLRMGFLDKAKKEFVGIFNAAWSQFEEGATYDVGFAVDGKAFDAALVEKVYGRKVGDLRGAEVTAKGPGMLEVLAAGQSMTFVSGGTELATVSLSGSADALEQVVACQASN